MMARISAACAVVVVMCLTVAGAAQRKGAPAGNPDPMARIAREYVRLVLALGQHDKDYVDAYYGPADIKQEAEGAKLTLDAIGAGVQALQARLAGMTAPPAPVSGEAAVRDERPRADAQGRAPVLRRRVQGPVRRGRADVFGRALPGL